MKQLHEDSDCPSGMAANYNTYHAPSPIQNKSAEFKCMVSSSQIVIVHHFTQRLITNIDQKSERRSHSTLKKHSVYAEECNASVQSKQLFLK
jgi:hypothetical protein